MWSSTYLNTMSFARSRDMLAYLWKAQLYEGALLGLCGVGVLWRRWRGV